MKHILLTSIILFLFLSCSSQDVKKNNALQQHIDTTTTEVESTLEIWSYGELPPYRLDSCEKIIGQKYNLSFPQTIGCEVTTEEMEKIKTHNLEVIAIFEKKHNMTWADFQAEVDECYQGK